MKTVLGYGGEIWGLRDWEELEKIHLLACKHILNVNTNTTTDAIYAELARNPLIASRHISSIKFALRLANLKCDKLSKKAYNLLTFDDAKSHYNRVSQVTELMSKYGIEMDDSDTRIKNKVNYHFSQALMSKIGKALLDQRKLRTSSRFKTVFKFEPYLNIIRNKQIRGCFSRFRMSSHDLEIERGRYDSKPKPPEERLCSYCRTLGFSLSEDEVHSSSVCPMYNKNRNRLFSFVTDLYPNVNTLNDKDKFVQYM